ncbi:MAG: ATP-binding protein [Bacteroidota bacterium]
MNANRIVITGGPGTGKSSVINELRNRNYTCYEEVSRQVTLDAQKKGIEQLFLTKPLLFSELILKAREEHFQKAKQDNKQPVFYDRGLPDVLAYMDYIKSNYPKNFEEVCEYNRYNKVYILPPWEAIYVSDNERYENFSQALNIHEHLVKTYQRFNYELISVPFGDVSERTDFILKNLLP